MDDMESNTRTLPPNWRVAKDSDGKEYYFNELTVPLAPIAGPGPPSRSR